MERKADQPKSETTKSTVPQAARRAAGAIGDEGQKIGRRAADSFSRNRAGASQRERNLEKAVREKPVTSVLIACAIGVFAGSVWKRL